MTDVRRLPLAQRGDLASLLDERSAADAMAAYYALLHPDDRVTLFVYQPTRGGLSGFLALARTGLDLFRPLAVPFVGVAAGLTELLRAALRPGRPVVLQIPLEQRAWAREVAEMSDLHAAETHRLDLRRYKPILNVLVVESQSPNGWPRYEIHGPDGAIAAAGLNWKGTRFAEIYLDLSPRARGHAYGASVLSAIARRLIEEKVTPLLRVAAGDLAAKAEAEELGFRPTGIQTLTCHAVLRTQPIGMASRQAP
jgi:GNAT superfamily N-acetyltransferase